MQVLVVEDSESSRTLLEALLAARGHEVTAVGDAEAALAAFNETYFPLVVLDWLLPGMSGLDLCREIRRRENGAYAYILMVTAQDRHEDLIAVLDAGADDYAAKPIDLNAAKVRFTVAERQVGHRLERRRAERQAADSLASLQRLRDDLVSILDKSQAGTAVIDGHGRIGFLSRTCRDMFSLGATLRHGEDWRQVLPLGEADRRSLEAVWTLPEAARAKVPVALSPSSGANRWLEVEVRDDPRDADARILFVYDVSAVHTLRRELEGKASFHDLVGRSPAMSDVFRQIQRVANVDSTVLIEGETGTGKELVARAVHYSGHRASGPFVAVNCAGLTESLLASQLFGHRKGAFTGAVADAKGYFEAADGGTIFLDEIGDIPASVQTSLLRVLQEREILRLGDTMPRKVDVRVIAATHHDLAEDVQRGTFRADLMYRIRVARLDLPPLRDRREDIPLLAQTFVEQLRAMRGDDPVESIARDAIARMLAYDWPGNVRELRGAIEFAMIRTVGPEIGAADLPPEVGERPAPTVSVVPGTLPAEDSRELILRTLEEVRGNRSLAAQRLGMSRSTFYRRLAEIGLVESTGR